MIDIFSLSLEELAEKIKSGQLTSVEVCETYIERIKKFDKDIKAWAHFDKKVLLEKATEADENQFTLSLNNEFLSLQDDGGSLDMEVSISGAGSGQHTGSIELSGISTIWVVHSDGVTSLQVYRPQ